MPNYDVGTLEEGAGRYYDEYYEIASSYERALPDRFRIFPTEGLNTEGGVRDILDWCRVPREAQVRTVGIRENVGQPHRRGKQCPNLHIQLQD